ncbi:multiple sugar transport system permease protein [Spinactinospora alkalitolerans]|uniref:Multiple sugar transport system permease protein n=1 Tax=Spinactinospora alkalitolerans TaxID=687207 RepID=A0A852U197_9ACTN|nr:sugar ABC transporter permease [Spinactinospora alkalitolerans]NYE47944.1 multiple sugar transport system permease protein [Spinactinospora alkalitolerans]
MHDFTRTSTGFLFLSPWFVGVAGLVVAPLAFSLYLSFTDYDLLGSPEWIGFGNYRELFGDDRYLHSMKLTLGYAVISVPLQLITALAAALLLAPARRGQGFYRALFYLPSLLGASVAVSITWRALFDYGGGVNSFLGTFGIEERSWVNDPSTVLWVIIALEIWRFGAPMVIFIAGLQQIPRELYEAASIDGSGAVTKFIHITVPMLSPIIFFNLVLGTIQAFQTFTPAQLVGDGRGGPADSTLFYAVNLYIQAFEYQRMGYASAIAWGMLAVLAVVAGLLFWSSRRWVHYGN